MSQVFEHIAFPNRLAEERRRAGLDAEGLAAASGIDRSWYEHIEAGKILPNVEELDRLRAALGGVAVERLYAKGLANTIGGDRRGERPDYAGFFSGLSAAGHLLVSRDEAAWLDRDATPDRQVEVFMRLSCGPQQVPHLMADTVGVLRALGVSFAAGAGAAYCCGTYYRHYGDTAAGSRMNDASVARVARWGARTTVHMCTQCQNTYSELAARRDASGQATISEDIQLLSYIERELRSRGAGVPWRAALDARVLVVMGNGTDGGEDASPVHGEARRKVADVLRLVPGVDVLGYVDPPNELGISFSTPPRDRAEVIDRRARLAQLVRSRGADTISHFHHGGQRGWSRYASEHVRVRHPISLVADALGCASPDRFQEMSMLGDPEEALRRLRPVWISWDMTEDAARRVARELFDPRFAGDAECGKCGGGQCRESLVTMDELHGVARRRPRGDAASA
jgi:transcriptional regulator with XRE-family HTH domain